MQPQTAFDRRPQLEFVDVRTPEEWAAGHVAGARNIPLDELAGRIAELGTGRPVMAFCRTGSRSARALEMLRSAGMDADHLEGGLKAWADQGLPLIAPDGSVGRVAPSGVRRAHPDHDHADHDHRDHDHGDHDHGDHDHGDHDHGDEGDDENPGTMASERVLGLLAAVREHFGDREPTDEEARAFFEDLLAQEGRTPAEIDEILS